MSTSSANLLSLAKLRELAVRTGFPDPDTAAAVAMAESGGNPSVRGDPQFGGSVGLWQINLPAHPEFDAKRLVEPDYNAHAALAISRNGTDWKPWTTFRNGAYLKYMPSASPPVAGASPPPASADAPSSPPAEDEQAPACDDDDDAPDSTPIVNATAELVDEDGATIPTMLS